MQSYEYEELVLNILAALACTSDPDKYSHTTTIMETLTLTRNERAQLLPVLYALDATGLVELDPTIKGSAGNKRWRLAKLHRELAKRMMAYAKAANASAK